jgi:hypothetical protein
MRRKDRKASPKPQGRSREEIRDNPGGFTRAELIDRLKNAERAERENRRRLKEGK